MPKDLFCKSFDIILCKPGNKVKATTLANTYTTR